MLLFPNWLNLPLPLRNEIATKFGVAKTGPTHVQNDRIVSDGYKVEDLANAFSDERLREYLDTEETDPVILWDKMVASFTPEVSQEKEIEEPESVPETIPEPVQEPKKRGRPAKK